MGLIYNAKVVTAAGKNYKNGYVAFDNGKIIEAGDMAVLPFPVLETDFDAAGLTLYPGFVDAHTHLGLFGNGVGFEAADCNEDSDPVTPHLRTIDSVNPMDFCFGEAARAGVTTIAAAPGSTNPVGGQILVMKTAGSAVLDKRVIRANAAIKFALGENPKGAFSERDESPVTRMGAAAHIREALFKARRYAEKLELYLTEPDDNDEPDFDMKSEALLPLLNGEISAHFHCHRADDIFTAVRIAREFAVRYVLIHATESGIVAGELAELREFAANPSNGKPYLSPQIVLGPLLADRGKPELANSSSATAAILEKAGIPAAICTDHPETPVQYLRLTAAAAVGAGLSEEAAVRAITAVPAEILGVGQRVGSIEPGKDADFVLLRGSFTDAAGSVVRVYVDGKHLHRYN
ncbi:hydrolase [Clostridia bacterium]|nr:hydrolase [Clostridia bacterium]